jgi:hypothetical protein
MEYKSESLMSVLVNALVIPPVKVEYLADKVPCRAHHDVAAGILHASTHRVTQARINQLTNWIFDAPDRSATHTFISKAIDNKYFCPFADPWNPGEIEDVMDKANGTKIIRLSTRKAGYLALSHINGIEHTRRLTVTRKGIMLGNFAFDDVDALMTHLDATECCVCMEPASADVNIVLTCGHIYHEKCLSDYKTISDLCPFCRKKQPTMAILDEGACCVYIPFTPS